MLNDNRSAFHVRLNADGSTIVRSRQVLATYPTRICDDLVRAARLAPDRPFIAQRETGAWQSINYATALQRVRKIGAALLRAGAAADAPLAVVAENSIAHALIALAAMYVGIPMAPVSTGYVTPQASNERLRDLLAVLQPGMFYAGSPAIAARLHEVAGNLPIIIEGDQLAGDPLAADHAFAGVDADGIAKIMFTSGSTGTPKGVITTNRMLCANQAMLAAAWPELTAAPVIVDWLPWSHCFGGNHNLGLVLHNIGTLYIDEGRPVPGAFAATVRNVADVAPTAFFSVPRGFALLIEELEANAPFATHFFSKLRVMCNAGASLADVHRHALSRLTAKYAPQAVRIASSWGMTETAPLVTTSWGAVEPAPDSIGTPVPGIDLKFAAHDGRAELRVRGPNVTPGYWRNAEATRRAFDTDGFYQTGDAGALADESDPERGVVFTGRLAENFKLSTGTWVNVGAIRLAALERGGPIIEDVVLTGHDRDDIGALVFISRAHAARVTDRADADLSELARDPRIAGFVIDTLARYNASAPASSTRIARAIVVPEPPNHAEGEITDKGSVNARRALHLRAALVEVLHGDPSHTSVLHLRQPARQT